MKKVGVSLPVVRRGAKMSIGKAKVTSKSSLSHNDLVVLGVTLSFLLNEVIEHGGDGVLIATYSSELGLTIDAKEYDPPQGAVQLRRFRRSIASNSGKKFNTNTNPNDILFNITIFVG